MPKKMILRRIPVEELRAILEYLQSNGTQYIDIVGISNESEAQDEILIAVKDEYMEAYTQEEENDNKMEGVANVVETEEEEMSLTEEFLINLL